MIYSMLDFAFGLYELGLLAYILSSWIMHPAAFGLRRLLAPAYEPLLAPIRRWVRAPSLGGTVIDLSPIILWIGLGVVQRMIFAILR